MNSLVLLGAGLLVLVFVGTEAFPSADEVREAVKEENDVHHISKRSGSYSSEEGKGYRRSRGGFDRRPIYRAPVVRKFEPSYIPRSPTSKTYIRVGYPVGYGPNNYHYNRGPNYGPNYRPNYRPNYGPNYRYRNDGYYNNYRNDRSYYGKYEHPTY